jgi:L-aspartate oxidase
LASTPGDSFDFIIVGGGIAGLRAAIELAPAGRVLILTKADATESNTGYAQGGIAAAVGPDDSIDRHAADTIQAGDGLCDEAAVRVLVQEGPAGVRDLISWGARFDRDPQGNLTLGLEAAHSVRRILHAGDATGREIGRALWQQVITRPSVSIIDHALVTDLAVEADRVSAVRFFDQSGARRAVYAPAILLATGGAGQVFSQTTNPAVATGDGIALGWHAGARLADLEFVQFHPTALKLPGAPRFLISEALRGEGAYLVNNRGERFMPRYHPDGDLAPRDVVARGIVLESDATGGDVFLTLSHLDAEHIRRRFPTIAAMCRQVNIDIARDLIPVGPAAHYLMGGVDTDEWGRTSLAGLFAAGETACTGVHGANRLASNSLLEGLVFGARAAVAMQRPPAAAVLKADRVSRPNPAPLSHATVSEDAALLDLDGIRNLMWRAVGLFRTRDRLEYAAMRLDAAYRAASEDVQARASDILAWRRLNLLTVARLMVRAALRREESRGGHFRQDFPRRDDLHWQVHLIDCIDH